MGMARHAEATDEGEAYPAPIARLRPSCAFEALKLAVVQAEHETRSATSLGDETLRAIENIREAADALRSAEERISELEATLDALRASTRRDLKAANDRAEHAETRLLAETERASSAERRVRVAEAQFAQIMAVIESELKPCAERD
jgi:hypothetical protein